MPRIPSVVIPGFPHHVTQRGNRWDAVFFTPDDRRRCLALLVEYAAKDGLGEDEVLSDPCGLTAELGPATWPRWLREPQEDEEAMAARLRLRAWSGRPAGGGVS